MDKSNNKCGTCFYCESLKLFDPVIHAFVNQLTDTNKEFAEKINLSSVSTIYKCHFAGKPQPVDPNIDYCHQWRDKND